MTIRYPDCIYCNNRGWFYKYVRHPFFAGSTPSVTPSFDKIEAACDCHYGQQYQIWQDKFNHPEYKNPLLSMTDAEVRWVLEYNSLNQEWIDAGFEGII